MKSCKKFLCLLLSLLMLFSVTQGISISAFADETNPFWIKVGADISKSSLTTSNAKTLNQNNDTSETEQLTITADGTKLKISGKTTLAPLSKITDYIPGFVTSFKNYNTNKFGGPYIWMEPVKKTDAKGNTYYTFSGEYDMSSVANGTYKMYVWRGYKTEVGNYYKFSGSLSDIGVKSNPGILHYANVLKVTNGNVQVLKYNPIATANTNAYNEMNAYSTDEFLDASLADIVFANKDPKDSGDKGSPLTEDQQAYIQDIAADITKNDTTDYDKVKSIYKYVAANLYYDDKRPGNVGTNSAYSNPYINLKGLIDKTTTNNYNIYNGKVATNCVGYAAMVAAMARSLNIPTRIVNGVHITEENWNTATNNLNVADHHWAECYVNDKWIMVDANMGNQNHYNGSTWTKTGLSNYAFFDSTMDEISTDYIVKAVYVYNEELANNPTTVELSKTSYIYDGKAKKPAVTVKNGAGADFAKSSYDVTYSNNVNVGTATVTVKFKAPYSGTINAFFKINPKATSVSSLTAQYKGFTVKWAKQATQTTGYQIQYSTSSKFTNAKTVTVKKNGTVSNNVTGLTAKKKYYVRIRTYKTVNGVSYYSLWSAAKNVTTSSYPTTITLSATSYTYNGKVKKPSVTVKNNGTKINSKYYTVSYSSGRKNVGTYTVTIKFKAPYSGTVKKTFTIKPKATTLSSVTAASKAFTVKWKKQKTQTTGYQILYSISSDFSNPKTVTVSKNSTTSKKITKLTAKRKYYVRVRTYKVVGKTKVCSAWSKAKTVTTKK